MSLKRSSLFILLSLASSSIFAKNYATFMGAGGEPTGPTTIFDRQARGMGNFVQKAEWETDLTFNGGHSTTEQTLVNTFGKKGITNRPFTEESYSALIKSYEDKINSGEITSADQIMLVISTHGAANTGKEKTHQISVTGGAIQDYNTGAGTSTVPMDKLENLTKLAEQKGIKLAIVDLSCHSGNALPLSNSKTCVISATGPNHYGYGGDGNAFPNMLLERFQKGKNLEEVFLSARDNYSDRSFPMISTPAGVAINKELYEQLTPYLYNYNEKHDKFSPFISAEAAKGEACEAPQELDELVTLINNVASVKKAAKNARYSTREAERFTTLLREYHGLMNNLRNGLREMNLPDLKPKEKFCVKYGPENAQWTTCLEYSLGEVMSVDLTWLENHYKAQVAKGGDTQAIMEASLGFIPQIKARREALIAEFPDLARKQSYFKDQRDLETKTTDLAEKVASAQRDLYLSLYRQKAAADTQPNPCKDFIL